MRLNRLRLQNFRLHADTLIEFDTGLTGIIGPNGSGKTTVLEAIAWALYGAPALRGNKKDVRSLSAAGRAAVKAELDFDLAGHRYRVTRSISGAELYLDGASAPIANSTTAVNDVLRRRLGMSHEEFYNTYFTGQKELGVMAAMGPAERAQFLSRVLGYEKLRGAQSLVRERRSVIRGELAGLQAGMPEGDTVARHLADAESRLTAAEKRGKDTLARLKKAHAALEEITPRWTAAQQEREAHHAMQAELQLLESQDASLARDVERLANELAEIQSARREIEEISAELNVHADLAAQLREMERLHQEEGRRKELVRGAQAMEQELTQLRQKLAAVATSDADLREAEGARERIRADLEAMAALEDAARTDWVRDKQEVMTKREALQTQYREVRSQRDRLADLGPESPCPICTRPLKDHFREVLDELDGKLSEIEVEGKYFRNRLDQLEEMPAPLRDITTKTRAAEAELERSARAVTDAQLRAQVRAQAEHDIADREKRLAETAAQLASIPSGYHATKHAQLTQQHAQLASLQERSVRLGTLAEREPKVRKDLALAQKDLAARHATLTGLRARFAASRFSEQAFEKLKSDQETAAAARHACELAALGAEKELEAAREAREAADAARRELLRAQERLRALTLERRMHEELDRAFTDIRGDLNAHLRPEISDLASGFLSELTDGRYTDLELDDDYNVIVKEDSIPKPVISGGEEDIANLVLRLAISQMIAERAGQAFSLLILDEVFGSLDETRRHNVIELLRRLHDRFEQVIVITHIESVREGLDRVLAVRYDAEAGISRVEQEAVATTISEADAEDAYAAAGAG